MSSNAKSTFHAYKKSVGKTGGGPAPRWEVVRTIEALKDTTNFKGLEGVDSFKEPENGQSSSHSSTVDVLKGMSDAIISSQHNNNDDDDDEDISYDDAVSSAAAVLAKFAASSTQPSILKRRHGDTNKEVQLLRILKKEEEIQNLRIGNLQLKKKKLQLEIELMEQKKNAC